MKSIEDIIKSGYCCRKLFIMHNNYELKDNLSIPIKIEIGSGSEIYVDSNHTIYAEFENPISWNTIIVPIYDINTLIELISQIHPR